jgi:hypothetical protein
VTESDIQQFAAISLAKYKIPTEIVFIDSIPRNPTGKILRRLLRDRPLEKGGDSNAKASFGGIRTLILDRLSAIYIRILVLGRELYGKFLVR